MTTAPEPRLIGYKWYQTGQDPKDEPAIEIRLIWRPDLDPEAQMLQYAMRSAFSSVFAKLFDEALSATVEAAS